MLKKHVFSPRACERLHMDAGRWALQLGEAYIFSCHANLNDIAFPLSSADQLLGVILAGPFLMDEPDSSLVSGIGENHPIASSVLLDLYDELHSVRVVKPAQVTVALGDKVHMSVQEGKLTFTPEPVEVG